MLNYLWAAMIIIGVVFGAFNGKMPDITNAALDSAKEAVTLCITMMGVMSFWVGMMEIATRAGIIEMASKKMRPLIRFLFPDIPEGHKANDYITTNFIANESIIIGLNKEPLTMEALFSPIFHFSGFSISSKWVTLQKEKTFPQI